MNQTIYRISYYKEKKVSVKSAIAILARNNVEVNEEEATMILDFLYQIATAYNLKAVESDRNHIFVGSFFHTDKACWSIVWGFPFL